MRIALLLPLFFSLVLCAAENSATKPLVVDGSGAVNCEGVTVTVAQWGLGWKTTVQSRKTLKLKKSVGSTFFTGDFNTPSGAFPFTQKVKRLSPDHIRCLYSLSGVSKENSKVVGLRIMLPEKTYIGREIRVDGKVVNLKTAEPLKGESAHYLQKAKAAEVVIPLKTGTLQINGSFGVTVQDERVYSPGSGYQIRLFAPLPEKSATVNMDVTFQFTPYRFTSLDLTAAVNMGFTDDAPEDGVGGWTDQGKENDLRMLPVGDKRLAGVEMTILDPAKNRGNSCIVLYGAQRQKFPIEKSVKVKGKYGWLYLLHASAWPARGATGKVVAEYTDGTKTEIKIGADEVGDWWAPSPRKNGVLGWTGQNGSSTVGLYLTKLPLDSAKELKQIRFVSQKRAVWGIVAASLSNDELSFVDAKKPSFIVENDTWKPLKTPWKSVEEGSVLDFSFLQDAPAGKHGRVVVKGGKFFFEDGTPARFYGVNLCGTANFPDKKGAEQLAKRLAMMGYNAVRFHHNDSRMNLRKADGTHGLDAENMDKIDYLLYCLRKEGLYVTIDLYVSRPFAKGEIPELPDTAVSMAQFKLLAFALDSARENWKQVARNMLSHVNPYTKLAWKDDPALVMVSLINEDVILKFSRDKKIKPFFQKLFKKWLKERKLDPQGEERKTAELMFLTELYRSGYKEMADFVKELGVKAPLTDLNHWKRASLSAMRADFDYIDMHCYWDHPQFLGKGWSPPSTLSNRSVIADYASTPIDTSLSRTFGRPMTITEFDYATPNEFRAEGAAVMGAYAAMQGWDALYRFAYAHSLDNISDDNFKPNYFDVGSDPMKALSERMGVALFLRGDVKAAELAYPVLISENCAEDPDGAGIYPREVWKLGLVGRTGNVLLKNEKEKVELPAGSKAAVTLQKGLVKDGFGVPVFRPQKGKDLLADMITRGVLDEKLVDPEKGQFNSSTGEIELAAKAQTFKVMTPRSEVLIGKEGDKLSGKVLTVENKKSRSVVFVTALDKGELATSKRLLLLHLTDCQMSKRRFASKQHTVYEASGEKPVLVRAGNAAISIKGDFDQAKVYAIDTSGKRIAEIPAKVKDGVLHFTADVFAFSSPCFAYEVVR